MKRVVPILVMVFVMFIAYTSSVWAAPITPGSFSSIWKTDNPGNSAANQVTFYTNLSGGGSYNYNVYWEEVGNDSNNGTTSATGLLTIDFPSPGTYRIDITGDFPALFPSGESQKLISIEQWGNISWRSMYRALYAASNARINASDAPDLSQVTSMDAMFCNATSMNDAIDHWDVSNVTDMGSLFAGAAAFNQSLSSWDVSNVTNMTNGHCSRGMFEDATAFDQSLATWELNAAVNIANLFQNAGISDANYSATLIGWAGQTVVPNSRNLGTVPARYSLTSRSARQSLTNSHNWTISDEGMYIDDPGNHTFVTVWDTSLDAGSPNDLTLYATGGAGYNFTIDWGDGATTSFTTDPGGDITHTYATPGVKTVTIVGYFPHFTANCNGGAMYNKITDVGAWGTMPWESFANAFSGCTHITNFSAVDTPNLTGVVNFDSAFQNAVHFNSDIGDWDVSAVSTMNNMFSGASVFNQPLANWDVSGVTEMADMFSEATAFDQNLSNWDMGNVTDAHNMLLGTAFSTTNYTAMLLAWSGQVLQNSAGLGLVGGVYDADLDDYINMTSYCSTAEAARGTLIDVYSWSINDGGSVTCVEEVVGGGDNGSGGTKVGVRAERLIEAIKTMPVVGSIAKFATSVRDFLTYLTNNEDKLEDLTTDERTTIIVALRDILAFLLRLVPVV